MENGVSGLTTINAFVRKKSGNVLWQARVRTEHKSLFLSVGTTAEPQSLREWARLSYVSSRLSCFSPLSDRALHRARWRKQGFIVAHSLRTLFIMAGKARWQGSHCHIASVSESEERQAGVQLASPFLLSLRPQAIEQYWPCLVCAFLAQFIKPTTSLTDAPRSFSPGWF